MPPLPLAGGGADSAGGLAYNAPMLTDITEKEVQREEERLLGRGQRYARVYLLTDCNNFFVSCERLFRPDLEGRPVLVLSNNDGCVVARSQEVKDLGIPMGVAVFKIRELIERHHIVCFSSNFNLYLDISQRIMRTLETLCEEVEIYSVDEAFLVLHDVSGEEAEEMAFKVRKTIACHIGVPVSVGVATSKTLAKLASHHAKQHLSETGGVYAVLNEVKRERLLRDNPVSEVWGVGRKLRERLNELQIETAYALSRCDLKKMRRLFSIVLVNTIRELNGEDVIEEGGTEGQAQSLKDLLNSQVVKDVVTSVTGGRKLTAANLTGTWRYVNPALQLKHDGALMNVAGTAATSELEGKLKDFLARAGVQEGLFGYVFAEDSTFTSDLKGVKLKGTYEAHEAEGTVTLRYKVAKWDALSLTADVVLTGERLTLLFEADKLLDFLAKVSSISGGTVMQAVNKLATTYEGLMLGFDLEKE